jgi:hypothetical protein
VSGILYFDLVDPPMRHAKLPQNLQWLGHHANPGLETLSRSDLVFPSVSPNSLSCENFPQAALPPGPPLHRAGGWQIVSRRAIDYLLEHFQYCTAI